MFAGNFFGSGEHRAVIAWRVFEHSEFAFNLLIISTPIACIFARVIKGRIDLESTALTNTRNVWICGVQRAGAFLLVLVDFTWQICRTSLTSLGLAPSTLTSSWIHSSCMRQDQFSTVFEYGIAHHHNGCSRNLPIDTYPNVPQSLLSHQCLLLSSLGSRQARSYLWQLSYDDSPSPNLLASLSFLSTGATVHQAAAAADLPARSEA